MEIEIRNEQNNEAASIEAVIVNAFANAPHTDNTEQLIVKKLRDANALTVSLVAESSGEIVGHVAISPVSISGGAKNWFGLGPISVLPELQTKGIGSLLMNQALEKLKNLGASGCVLLGDPNYYSRFGFKNESSLVLPNVPQEYFQAISLDGRAPSGIVSYHPAFQQN